VAEEVLVIWKSYHEPEFIARGYWDQGILEDLFTRPGELSFRHATTFDAVNEGEGLDRDGAVVVINARSHLEDIDKINADISRLRWCLLILTGDEEGQFLWQHIRHPMLRTWVQLPRMNVHNDVAQKLPNGARPDTRKLLKAIGPQPKTLEFIFAGQVNHDRREQCVEAARALEPNYSCHITETDAFGKETVPHPEYLNLLAHSKIVLCPSGIETPDTFRLYEALEAGCLPIVDAFASRNQDWGFWNYLFKGEVPFPIIPYWSDLPALLPELLRDYPHNANRASAWWQSIKRDLYFKLVDNIKELNR
jgi:hypothetical protein